MVSSNAASVSATVLFTFFLLCVSLAETKTAISRHARGPGPLEAARVGTQRAEGDPLGGPGVLGHVVGVGQLGIHFGETKLVISMRRSPARTSASMRRSLPRSGTVARSFCRPSRSDTS